MSKTIVANPIAGLKGIPARITLEENSLTIKSGLFGAKSLPYSSIESVSFTGVDSLTLSGSIVISPMKGQSIKLFGFYKSQFSEVQRAVTNGYYSDLGNNTNNCGQFVSSENTCQQSEEVTIAQIKAQEKEDERKAEREKREAEIDAEKEKREADRKERKAEKEASDILSIQQIAIETTDADLMIKTLNHLIGVIDSTEGGVKNAALSKYKTQLEYLKNTNPSHPMLKMFKSKYKKSKTDV